LDDPFLCRKTSAQDGDVFVTTGSKFVQPIRGQAFVLFAASILLLQGEANAQGLVIAPSHDGLFEPENGDPLVIIPDLSRALLNPQFVFAAPPSLSATGYALKPHGLAVVSENTAIVTHLAGASIYGQGELDIIDTVHATRTGIIDIPDYRLDGGGSVAVNPAKTHLLLFSQRSAQKLFVVAAPFSASSVVNEVAMPSNGGYAQVRAIAFDNATGRAFVGQRDAISALDPPYTSIAFTIPFSPSAQYGRSVALSSDGSVMVTTNGVDNLVQVLHAPYSNTSTPVAVSIPPATTLDGLTFVSGDRQLLVVDSTASAGNVNVSLGVDEAVFGSQIPSMLASNPTLQAYAISAPFAPTSTVEVLDTGLTGIGFEDVDVSADGRFAALSGQDDYGVPLVILQAPFTAAGVRTSVFDIPALMNGYGFLGGRGTGAARFWSSPIATLPQIMPDAIVTATEGDSGTSPMILPVRLSRPSSQSVTVDYATSDIEPGWSTHYVATSGTLTFAPGETRKTISIPIIGDTTHYGIFQFNMTFSNPVNASLLENNARLICMVEDNDGFFVLDNASPVPDAYVGVPLLLTFTAHGSPGGYVNWITLAGRFDPSSAAPGLSMDPDSGVLSGTPTQAGRFEFGVQVSDSANTATAYRYYELTIGSDRIFADGFE
jgi:hypothetical protein